VNILSVLTCYIKSTKLIAEYELAFLLVEDLMALADDLQQVGRPLNLPHLPKFRVAVTFGHHGSGLLHLAQEWSNYPMHIYGAELCLLLDFFMSLILKNPVVAGWAFVTVDEIMGIANSFFDVCAR